MADMEVESYVFGIFPRDEELIEATRSNSKDLKKLMARKRARVISLQRLTYASDPLLGWDDIFRPIALGLSGVEVDGLGRFFETNTFYRAPVVKDKIAARGHFLRESVAFNELKGSRRPFLLEVPDPFCFTSLCRNEHYGDRAELLLDFARALNGELKEVRERGFRLLVIKGPSFAFIREPDDFRLVKAGIEELVKGLRVTTVYHTYFKDVSDRLGALESLPVTGLGFDLAKTRLASLKGYPYDLVALSAVDGRNSLIERAGTFVERATNLVRRSTVRRLMVTNNSDLELLPYSIALKKLKGLGAAERGLRRAL
jgi:5-methyltetrahydropteroyltriglutamate--homocysteine methyltransferase